MSSFEHVTREQLCVEELQVLCAEWQEVLGLRDWRIAVRLARYHELSSPDHGAEVSYQRRYQAATISLRDPNDSRPTAPYMPSLEENILHELLHLRFVDFSPDEEDIAEEQAINALARGMLALKRRASV